NWLLARAAAGDSAWVVDLDAEHVVGTVRTRWAGDLPVVAAPRTVVAREGGDVVARDLGSPALPETGRVKAGAADLWITVNWAPAPVATVADATPATARVVTPAPPPPTADTSRAGASDTAAP